MADNVIKISPEALKMQAEEMEKLRIEYENLWRNLNNDLNKINTSWSEKMSHNFLGKIVSAQKCFQKIEDSLEMGAKVATSSATTFESVDKLLAKEFLQDETDSESGATKRDQVKDMSQVMKYLNKGWIDESDYPMWIKELSKKIYSWSTKKLLGDNKGVITAYEITQLIFEGDYVKATEKFASSILKEKGGNPILSFLGVDDMETDFWINVYSNGITSYCQYAKEPSVINLLNIGWSAGVESFLETGGDCAWNIVKLIPGISNYYEEKGIDSTGEAFNDVFVSTVSIMCGEEIGESVSTYYSDHGSLFYGLASGVKELSGYINESGGFTHNLIEGWKSIWNDIF